jgi:hypothetical protein
MFVSHCLRFFDASGSRSLGVIKQGLRKSIQNFLLPEADYTTSTVLFEYPIFDFIVNGSNANPGQISSLFSGKQVLPICCGI